MKSLVTFFKGRTLEAKGAILSLSSILAIILSMKEALIGLTLLILVDLLTGIRKNHFEWGIQFRPLQAIFWKSIKSYLLRKTWVKFYEYGIGIIVVLIFENLIFGSQAIQIMGRDFKLAELAVVFPAIIEIWSIYENLEAVSQVNLFKSLLKFMPSWVQSAVNKEKPE
jgi:hypothetical protein